MALTSVGTIWDRVADVVAAQGFTRARNAFDFDQQPDGNLDAVFHMRSDRISTMGYIGGDQAEQHAVEIFLARRVRRDSWGAARQLKTDMDLIEAVLVDDNVVYDYCVEDDSVSSEVQPPGEAQDYVVARLKCTIDFDRII